MIDLPQAHYRLEVTAREQLQLPDYAGSMLRGAWGHALMAQCGLTPAGAAKAPAGCLYRQVFSPAPMDTGAFNGIRTPPVPYVLRPPAGGARTLAPGQSFSFGITLLGPALARWPELKSAWARACATGLGKTKARCELTRCEPCTGAGALPNSTSVQLEFITPLRLQKQKRLIGADSITSLDIHTALLRRLSLLLHCYGQGGEPLDIRALLEQARQQHGQGRLYWYDWRRYSTRQKRTMSLGGLLGSWRIYNLSAPWLALMHMGQYLHLGKEAAFGLGHYQLTAI